MKETPMMSQYNSFKRQYPDKIVLFRMGDFYETFGEDAKITAEILNITLTSRDKNSDPTPLAGFPYHALDQYLPKLVEAGKCAVVVDQLEDPKLAKGVVKRGVTRIVTPGTLEGELAPKQKNQFLASFVADKKRLGVAVCDLSIGTLEVADTDLDKNSIELILNSYDPDEVLFDPDNFHCVVNGRQVQFVEVGKVFDKRHKDRITEFYRVSSMNAFGIDEGSLSIPALSMLLEYIEDTQKMKPVHIQSPKRINLSDTMVLDRSTIKNLDLLRNNYTGDSKESLLGVLDNCKTAMGRRQLYSWIINPLIDHKAIIRRHSIVRAFQNDVTLLENVRIALSSVSDIQRIIGKMGLNRMNGRDMKAMEITLESVSSIIEEIEEHPELAEIYANENDLPNFKKVASEIVGKISETIVDSPPLSITEGGLIKDGVLEEIDEIRSVTRDSRKWLKDLEITERESLSIPSLKVRSNKVFGYYIEVTKAHSAKVPDHYIRKQTLVNSERYITEELKKKEDIILHADERLSKLEYEEFQKLREYVLQFVAELRSLSEMLVEIDILVGFADLALLNGYVEPVIHPRGEKEGILSIKAGRHPVVEKLIEDQFIDNDTELSIQKDRIMIITGPNMSGKSTYIRQTALIVLMAQIGSFVPAQKLEMSVVDRIFSRVGASDDLAQGRSTFMVEMEEAANIINNATEDSLIILDEIGRGTSTYDGVSIAWALVEHIAEKIKARTLFATHYHELTSLESEYPDIVKNYNVMVKDDGDEVVFMRKIIPGGTDKSYGIYVASLAGIPEDVIKKANSIMETLDIGKALAEDLTHASKPSKKSEPEVQFQLFDHQNSEILQQLNAIDINEITPLEALNILQKLVERAKSK